MDLSFRTTAGDSDEEDMASKKTTIINGTKFNGKEEEDVEKLDAIETYARRTGYTEKEREAMFINGLGGEAQNST